MDQDKRPAGQIQPTERFYPVHEGWWSGERWGGAEVNSDLAAGVLPIMAVAATLETPAHLRQN